jgi:hypothetical protein
VDRSNVLLDGSDASTDYRRDDRFAISRPSDIAMKSRNVTMLMSCAMPIRHAVRAETLLYCRPKAGVE